MTAFSSIWTFNKRVIVEGRKKYVISRTTEIGCSNYSGVNNRLDRGENKTQNNEKLTSFSFLYPFYFLFVLSDRKRVIRFLFVSSQEWKYEPGKRKAKGKVKHLFNYLLNTAKRQLSFLLPFQRKYWNYDASTWLFKEKKNTKFISVGYCDSSENPTA